MAEELSVRIVYTGGRIPDLAIVLSHSMRGWLCYRHPDGQWVSLADVGIGELEAENAELLDQLRVSGDQSREYSNSLETSHKLNAELRQKVSDTLTKGESAEIRTENQRLHSINVQFEAENANQADTIVELSQANAAFVAENAELRTDLESGPLGWR